MKLNTILAIGVGLGLALFPIRNPEQPLLHYFYAPTVAYALFGICAFLFVIKSKKIELGNKWVWIPMLVILASTLIRFIFFGDKNGLPFVAIAFVLYLIGYKVGDKIFRALIPFSIVVILTVIYHGLKYNDISGGLLMGYNLAVGYITYAAVTNRGKWQWLLVTASIVGLLFTGSAEALIVIGVVGIVVLVRRDWSKRLWIPLCVLALTAMLLTNYSGIYSHTSGIVDAFPTITQNKESVYLAFSGRFEAYGRAWNEISLFGHGFEINNLDPQLTVHSVPFIVIDQLGIFAGMAWLFVTVYCLIKTKWKYAWIAFIALSLFDHFNWTHIAPLWWVLIGVSTSSNIENDYIFKEKVNAGLLVD